jgi:Peptidase family M28
VQKQWRWMLAAAFALLIGFPTCAQESPAAPEHLANKATFLEWPLAPEDQEYASIDGKHLHQYVTDQIAISDHYRDAGHQLWGRITGTSADADNQQWLLEKFKRAGLSDVHAQIHDLPPQWLANSWEVSATANGKTMHLESAQPTAGSVGTPPGGLDLEVAYVGLGSEAEFAGRDVRGKAVFVFSVAFPGSRFNTAPVEGALKRAEDHGAAAIFNVVLVPGNIRIQLYSAGTKVPTFSMGMKDGYAVREMIGNASPGQVPHVKIQLDAPMVPDLKSATIWGTLPGMTDETIYVVAHRDAWFEGSSDDASGVATMLGLAEYFAQIPKEKRRRTIIFLGTTGHHATGGSATGRWLAANHETVFAKTALIINCEHTATTQMYFMKGEMRKANNTDEANLWYVHGSPLLTDIALKAWHRFGEPLYQDPEPVLTTGEMSPFYKFGPSLQVIDTGAYLHSDMEDGSLVPWTGLQVITRAYAKIINEVNNHEIKDLVPVQSSAGADQ